MPVAEESFRLSRIALPAYGPTALASLGHGAVLPVLALSARELGASVGVAALTVALLGIGQLAASLPSGALAARIGERRSLLVAGVVDAVAMTGALLAGGVWALASAVFAMGVAGALFNLARQAYLTEVVPVSMRARALSTLGGVHRIGLFVGPFVGAAVVSWWDLRAAYAVAVVASAAAFLLVLVLPDL
ncbi:MAG TPA: MFS transporter, partial [Pedococcus sp.]